MAQRRMVAGEKRREGRRDGGFLLLSMLIAVVIGMVIYYFSVYRPDKEISDQQQGKPADYPWQEEWRVVGSKRAKPRGDEWRELSAVHPDISRGLTMYGYVQDDQGQPRGKLEFVIHPDGTLGGTWSGKFRTESNKAYDLMGAGVEGNVDATKVYRDEEGEMKEYLYLIGVGKFTMLEERKETSKMRHVAGFLYLTGWLSPESTAMGRLHLTNDRKKQTVYSWTTKEDLANPYGGG